MEHLAMNVLGPLLLSVDGRVAGVTDCYILVVFNYLSKRTEELVLQNQKAVTFTHCFLLEIPTHFGTLDNSCY